MKNTVTPSITTQRFSRRTQNGGCAPYPLFQDADQGDHAADSFTPNASDVAEVIPPIPVWLLVSQMAAKHPAFTENALRALIFAAKPRVGAVSNGTPNIIPGNGLAVAIRRVGRRVLINEMEFLGWVDRQGSGLRQPSL